MDKKTLEKALKLHEEWLEVIDTGERLDLRNTNLRNADLSLADLSGANLRSAYLRSADLSGSDLGGSDLGGADLRSAYLRSADLSFADLSGADLTWVDTQNVKGQKVISVQVDTSRLNNMVSYWANLGVWTTGCFQGSLEELKENIESTHKDNELLKKRYYRVIDFILNEAEEDEIGS